MRLRQQPVWYDPRSTSLWRGCLYYTGIVAIVCSYTLVGLCFLMCSNGYSLKSRFVTLVWEKANSGYVCCGDNLLGFTAMLCGCDDIGLLNSLSYMIFESILTCDRDRAMIPPPPSPPWCKTSLPDQVNRFSNHTGISPWICNLEFFESCIILWHVTFWLWNVNFPRTLKEKVNDSPKTENTPISCFSLDKFVFFLSIHGSYTKGCYNCKIYCDNHILLVLLKII